MNGESNLATQVMKDNGGILAELCRRAPEYEQGHQAESQSTSLCKGVIC